jgi:hypothetical protein
MVSVRESRFVIRTSLQAIITMLFFLTDLR